MAILLASAAYAQVGAVLSLDGSSGIDFPSGMLDSDMENASVDFWFYADSYPGNEPVLVGTYTNYGCTLYSNEDMFCYVGGTDSRSAHINLNQWYHVVYAFSGNRQNLSVYIDGSLYSSIEPTTATSTGSYNPFKIGYNPGSGYLDGFVDEARVYNRTLSPEEVLDSYNNGINRRPSNVSTSGLMGYWPLDGDVIDLSGNGNNGTLVGNPYFSSFAVGNSSNVTTTGITGLNVTIDGSDALNGTYTGMKDVIFIDQDGTLFNLSHNFTIGMIDLTKVSIEKSSGAIAFNFSGQLKPGDVHSFYVPNNLGDTYFCPTAKTLAEVSPACYDAIIFTQSELWSTKYTLDQSFVTATTELGRIKITTNSTADDGGGGSGPVPEFSTITLMLALAIVISGFLVMRNRREKL